MRRSFHSELVLPSQHVPNPNPDNSNWGPVIKVPAVFIAQWIRSMDRFTHGPPRTCSQHLSDKNRHNPLLMTAEASISDGWLLPTAAPYLTWCIAGIFSHDFTNKGVKYWDLKAEQRVDRRLDLVIEAIGILKQQSNRLLATCYERSPTWCILAG